MSRIHDALKKAELEHGRAQSPQIDAAIPSDEASRKERLFTHGSAHTLALAADLRFEEVVARCTHPEWHPDPRVNLFVNPSQPLHSIEPFRTLRSRLYQLRSQEPLKIILVTSAIAGEGKTFVAANLAHSIVRQKQRSALLIDADLRCARQHLLLRAPVNPGLTDYLREDADEMAVIQHGQEGNLCFIASGQTVPDPNELLSTSRLKTLLQRISPAFDWVIIDSPPCLPVADSRIIADVCDGVLFVLGAASTPLEVAQKSLQKFAGKKILGLVLNRIEEGDDEYSPYYDSYD
jgi:protein-tyrosine kinase